MNILMFYGQESSPEFADSSSKTDRVPATAITVSMLQLRQINPTTTRCWERKVTIIFNHLTDRGNGSVVQIIQIFFMAILNFAGDRFSLHQNCFQHSSMFHIHKLGIYIYIYIYVCRSEMNSAKSKIFDFFFFA